jgi:phosphatidylcholine synthase
VAALPLLASSYQFCRVDAKTEDHAFLGFPSYWNVVAFYAVVLDLAPAVVAAVLVVCSVLVFVPVRYLYPSRTAALRGLSLVLTAVWLVTYAVLLVQVPDPAPVVVALSLAYLVYYVAVSLWLTARAARRRRGERPATG